MASYPKMLRTPAGDMLLVDNEEQEAAVVEGRAEIVEIKSAQADAIHHFVGAIKPREVTRKEKP